MAAFLLIVARTHTNNILEKQAVNMVASHTYLSIVWVRQLND